VIRRLARRLCALAVIIPVTAAGAQVKPDTAKRTDSVSAPVPVAAPLPQPPAGAKSAADSIAQDSIMRARILARTDSVQRVIAADTVKAPLARYETPRSLEVTERLHWRRDSILATGALNLADLLDRVPGITSYRSGWLAGVHAASFNGDGSRIRVFLDGVELDAVEPRNGGMLDLTDVPIWNLDEVQIERAPGEVRVWLQSMTVTSTTPATRVDIFTGDLNTNAFRGFLSRRWRNGFAFQFGGQQIATQSGRVSAFTGQETGTRLRSDGELQAFYLRLGWSRRRWSADVFANATSRDRDGHTPRTDYLALPGYKGQRRDAYVRLGYGDTTRGFWSQALLSAVRTRQQGSDTTLVSGKDSIFIEGDTIRGQTQHVLAVGYRASWWSASLTNRLRPTNGALQQAPVVRGQLSWWKLDAGTWIERNGRDSTDRSDLFARLRPLTWMTLLVGRSSRTPADTTGRPAGTSLRAEAAVRFKGLWLGGGLIRDGVTTYSTIPIIGAQPGVIRADKATGVTASVHGRLYKDLQLDVQAITWDAAQYNRPRMQFRTELALVSEWRRKFPKGQFGFNARLILDSRSRVPFYYGEDEEPAKWVSEPAIVATGLLEIRIQRGTLFYQYRNLTGGQYEQIRGITMPPAVQLYGMRWQFFN
jgi:hypothetical protein